MAENNLQDLFGEIGTCQKILLNLSAVEEVQLAGAVRIDRDMQEVGLTAVKADDLADDFRTRRRPNPTVVKVYRQHVRAGIDLVIRHNTCCACDENQHDSNQQETTVAKDCASHLRLSVEGSRIVKTIPIPS